MASFLTFRSQRIRRCEKGLRFLSLLLLLLWIFISSIWKPYFWDISQRIGKKGKTYRESTERLYAKLQIGNFDEMDLKGKRLFRHLYRIRSPLRIWINPINFPIIITADSCIKLLWFWVRLIWGSKFFEYQQIKMIKRVRKCYAQMLINEQYGTNIYWKEVDELLLNTGKS